MNQEESSINLQQSKTIEESQLLCFFQKVWRWLWLKKYFTQDGFIYLLEFLIISAFSIAILSIIIYYLLWIFFGIGDEISGRIFDMLDEISDNWKVFLIIIVPLFLRPIRILLERPEKMKGIFQQQQQPSQSGNLENPR